MYKGIDVSSYQGTVDWNKVKQAGYSFAIVKCSQGIGYRNPYYTSQINGARAAGLLIGHYHFFDNSDTWSNQMAWFKSNLDTKPGDVLALDVETTGGEVSSSSVNSAMLEMQSWKLGTSLLYSNPSFISGNLQYGPLGLFPLWVASYLPGSVFPTPPSPWSGKEAVIWQHSSSVSVPGVNGPCDEDYCLDLTKVWNMSAYLSDDDERLAIVVQAFDKYLGRPPNTTPEDETTYWVGQITANGVGQTLRAIAATPEAVTYRTHVRALLNLE